MQGAFVYWSFLPGGAKALHQTADNKFFFVKVLEWEKFIFMKYAFSIRLSDRSGLPLRRLFSRRFRLGQTSRNNFVKKNSLQPRKVDLGRLLDHLAYQDGPFRSSNGRSWIYPGLLGGVFSGNFVKNLFQEPLLLYKWSRSCSASSSSTSGSSSSGPGRA